MPPREVSIEGPFSDEKGRLTLLAGLPILDIDNGGFGGVVIIRVRLDAFEQRLKAVSLYDENPVWLYAADGDEESLMQRLDAKPVDSGENLRILVPEDLGVFFKAQRSEGRLRATNPIQTYVDLMHCGGRGEEAAEAILGQCLKPAWELKK